MGNVSSLKDGKAQATYYQYDVVNLQNRIDYPDGNHHYFEFDNAREQTAFADPSGRTTMQYDALSRMIARSNPGSLNVYYQYDPASNRVALVDPDGVAQSWGYDPANRMTGAGYGYGIQAYGTSPYGGYGSTLTYDLANEMIQEVHGNGSVSYYNFDAAGRTSLIRHQMANATLIESWTYTRDEAGNILQQVRGTDSMNTYWNYDAANRITLEAWRSSGGTNVYGFTYTYDGAGNRITKSNTLASATTYWEYDLADQMTRQRSGSPVAVYFGFDSNGNLSYELDTNASAGLTYYTYEPRNLLTQSQFPTSIAPMSYFYYNAVGERIRKDDSTAQKQYTWDGLLPIVEKNLSNTTTQRLVKGYTPISGIGEYVFQELSSGRIHPHKNQVGTTMRMTDLNANVVSYYEYDAWGQPLVTQEGTGLSQQYRYTQKELDPDFVDFNSVNRRYHFPWRVFFPFRGVFAQIDPLLINRWVWQATPHFHGEAGRVYVYVAGRPTTFIDPRGLQLIPRDPDAPPPFNVKKSDGEAAFKTLGAELAKLCENCCPCDECTKAQCQDEAAKIGQAILNTWTNNFNEKENKEALVGGHVCWDWAKGFDDVLEKKLKLSCWGKAMLEVKKENRHSDIVTDVHFYLVLRACKNPKDKCLKIIDDGILQKGFIHDPPYPPVPPWKQGPTEWPPDGLGGRTLLPVTPYGP